MTPLIIDEFCGAGGASIGIHMALGRSPDIAINHSPAAIRQHQHNHPDTKHYQCDIWAVSPREATQGHPVGLLWASPACTHFSRAKGAAPVDKRIRSLAWVVIKWAVQTRPAVIMLENVEEFEDWGPLLEDPQTGNQRPDPTKKGKTFRLFVNRLRGLGYAVEWRALRADHFGTPTIRSRFFLVARCDGKPICWPASELAKPAEISTLSILDLSIPVLSIFGRKKPLVAATIARLSEGFRRYVLQAENPCFIQVPSASAPNAAPSLAAAWIAKHYTGATGIPATAPLGTITTVDHHALCVAWISSYYGSGGQWADARQPLPTIVTKGRHALCLARLAEFGVVDVGMRMLAPHELAAAQGFPPEYEFIGTNEEQIAGIGNSVCPRVAAALVSANCAHLRAEKETA